MSLQKKSKKFDPIEQAFSDFYKALDPLKKKQEKILQDMKKMLKDKSSISSKTK